MAKTKIISFSQFTEKIKKLQNSKEFKEKILKKNIAPKLKEQMQEQIKEDIINQDFVDSNGKYRYYWQKRSQGGYAKKRLGAGNTQASSYKRMANNRYFVTEISASAGSFIGHIEIYNNFPVGKSIYNTPITGNSNPHLYTQWLVDGNIVMPTLKRMSYGEWQVYCKDPANRYKARPYVDNLAAKLSRESKEQNELQRIMAEKTAEQIVKLFKQ